MTRSTYPPILRHPIFVPCALFAFVTAYLLIPAGNAIVTRGEGREALVVRAMDDQNNLVLPLRNGVTIPSKPPLFHWLGFASSRIAGSLSERAIRFPSILAAAMTLTLFYLIFRRRLSPEPALLSVLILLTSMDFLRTATAARVDMLFTLWASLATWLLFEACEKKEGAMLRTFVAGACMGFAVLTKGPAGIVLPIAVGGVYVIVSRGARRLPLTVFGISGAIAIAVALPWYLAAYKQGGQQFLDVQLMRENVARLVAMSEYDVGHESSRLSVVGMILSGLLPWTFFLPLVISQMWVHRSKLFAQDRALLFSVIWAGFYLAFFTLTTSRRNVYLLPSYPAYAYIFGSMMRSLPGESSRLLRTAGWLCVLLTGILAVATLDIVAIRWFDVQRILSHYGASTNTLDVAENLSRLEIHYLLLCLLALVAFAKAARQIFSEAVKSAVYSLVLAQLLLGFAVHAGIMSKLSASQSPKVELPTMLEGLEQNSPLYQFRHDFYSIDFYANRVVETVHVRPKITEGTNAYLLVSEEELSDARAILGHSTVAAQSKGPIANGKERLFILKFS